PRAGDGRSLSRQKPPRPASHGKRSFKSRNERRSSCARHRAESAGGIALARSAGRFSRNFFRGFFRTFFFENFSSTPMLPARQSEGAERCEMQRSSFRASSICRLHHSQPARRSASFRSALLRRFSARAALFVKRNYRGPLSSPAP